MCRCSDEACCAVSLMQSAGAGYFHLQAQHHVMQYTLISLLPAGIHAVAPTPSAAQAPTAAQCEASPLKTAQPIARVHGGAAAKSQASTDAKEQQAAKQQQQEKFLNMKKAGQAVKAEEQAKAPQAQGLHGNGGVSRTYVPGGSGAGKMSISNSTGGIGVILPPPSLSPPPP